MKRIVFLIPSLGMGGMERVLVNYVNILSEYNYDVTVINFTFSDSDLKSLVSERVHYFDSFVPVPHFTHAGIKNILRLNFRIMPWLKWIQFHSAKYLYKKYIKEQFDIEVGFCGSPAIKIVSGSDNPNSQKLGWIHGDNILNDVPQAGGFFKAKKIYSEIQKLICVSDIAVEDIKNIFHRENGLYKLINPNDVNLIRKLGKETVSRSNVLTFVCVGRVIFNQKGFDSVVEAAHMLNEEGYQFCVWFVGDGLDYDALNKMINDYGLSNVITYGQQSNPYKYINCADVLLCSSIYEAYGMVVAEALILGKPVISTDAKGPSEILQNGKFGMIVDKGVDGIYRGMKAVLDDKTLLEGLKKKALSAKGLFDPSITVKEFEKIIDN